MTRSVILPSLLSVFAIACQENAAPAASTVSEPAMVAAPAPPPKAPTSDLPPLDPTNIVSIALGSKDHTTLVTALKAADYVGVVANPGPLTVFAPTNGAFAKLPAGTVDGLLAPEKQGDLQGIIKYHATTSVYKAEGFKDGQTLGMANGKKVTLHVKDGKVMVNDANIVASVPASNGIVHIVDAVLLPPPG